MLYNLSNSGPKALYVGKTQNTCLQRRQSHISKSRTKSCSTLPISKFILKIGADNLGIFPLMSVPQYHLYSHHYERYWIHKLHTHLKHSSWYFPLNKSVEHSTFTFRRHSRSKLQTHNLLPHTQPIQYSMSHPILKTLYHLLHAPQFPLLSPPSLIHMSNHKLYKLLSTLQGTPLFHYKKPFNSKLNNHYTQLCQYSKNLSTHSKLLSLSHFISSQIDSNHQQWSRLPPKSKFSPLNIIVTQHSHLILKKLKIPTLLQKYITLLPKLVRNTITPKLIFSSPPPISKFLFNFKTTTQSPIPHSCQCHLPQFQSYIREHNHIDTLDPSIISKFPSDNLTHTQLIKLIKYGTKFIETPPLNKRKILNQISESLNSFISKISSQYQLSPNSFQIWLNKLTSKISNSLNILYSSIQTHTHTPILSYPPVKQLISLLHNDLVINCADKLPTNFSFCCKKWWMTELINSTINSKSYKVITHTTTEAIIQRHKAYLEPLLFTVTPTLPYKRLMSKYHKLHAATRPLVSASNVTTSSLDKTLTIAMTALIQTLKIQSSLFEKIHGYSWFFDIDQATDVIQFLNKLNQTPQHSPTSIRTADADGFYDSIQHFWLINKFRSEIPKLYTHHNAQFLIVNLKSKTYKWETHSRNSTKTIHCLSSHLLIKLLMWSLRNQFQTVGPHIVRQTVDVGQGLSHSGHVARFSSILSERDFILTLHSNNPIQALSSSLIRRKHDDIFILNFLNFESIFHIHALTPGLYPWFIKPSYTNQPPYTSADYLNLTIQISPNPFKNSPNSNKFETLSISSLKTLLKKRKLKISGSKSQLIERLNRAISPFPNFHNKTHIWTTTPFSKKSNFPQNIQQIMNSFPHFSSNLPYHVKTGTVIEHLHTLHRTTSHDGNILALAICQFLKTLAHKNLFPKRLLKNILFKFLDKNFPSLHMSKQAMVASILYQPI